MGVFRRVAMVAVLAGCTGTPAPYGVQSVVVAQTPGVAAPAAQGQTDLVVRAVPAGVAGEELLGAACVAESPYFSASFTTPARLLLPDYGPAAPVVTVSCRAGNAAGSLSAQPGPAWSGGLAGWPAIGISVGTGSGGWDGGGVGVGLGWYGGAVGTSGGGGPARYPELRVPLVEGGR
jgi:hypothetical protein